MRDLFTLWPIFPYATILAVGCGLCAMAIALDRSSLPEYFRAEVGKSLQTLNVEVSEHTEFYVVNLLTQFSKTERLFESKDKQKNEALALQFFEAMLVSSHSRAVILKRMGDVALYTSGFFCDSFFRKMIKPQYYIQMGYTAYSSLAQMPKLGRDFQSLYEELARNFSSLVDVLGQIADSTPLKSDQSILKLYERWLSTGSKRIKKLLEQEGIVPNPLVSTKAQ